MNVSPTELPWLKRFFASPNQLRWEDLEEGRAAPQSVQSVMPWLSFLHASPPSQPVVLPVFDAYGPKCWYGVASNDQAALEMAQEVQAFVGPTYSDFTGRFYDLSPDDPIEVALRDRFGRSVIRLAPIKGSDANEIQRQLLIYQRLLARRPGCTTRGQRPFGRIRGDFDRALLSGNTVGAQQFLQELLRSGRVTADQSRFLEIRYLAGLGRLEELARNQSLISSVVDLQLPPQTLADVVRALYETHVAPIEFSGNIDAITKAFRDNVERRFGPLFRERKGVVSPEVLRAFLLHELNADEPNQARCEALLRVYPKDAHGRSLAEQFLERLGPRRLTHDALAQAKQAIAHEDYGAAFEFAMSALPNPWAYRALVRCAVELQSSDVTQRVLDRLRAASSEVLESFTNKDKQRLEQLEGGAGRRRQSPSNWIDWAVSVNSDPDVAQVSPLLESAVVTWSDEEFLKDSKSAEELARQIGNAKGRSEEVFREALPYLIQFFVDRPARPQRLYLPIYVALVRLLAWADSVSADELRLASSAAEAVLAVGPNKEAYEECIEALIELLEHNKVATNVDWALDTSELIVRYTSPLPEIRLRFFMQTIGLIGAVGHRVSSAQRTALELLAQDYSSPDLLSHLPRSKHEEEGETLSGRDFAGLIALYSLSEGSVKRASEVLRKHLPSARVEINSDTTATDRLRALAKRADIFAFAWKKSTHPAFYCAKDARGERDILHAPGGGAASLVKSVMDHLQSQS